MKSTNLLLISMFLFIGIIFTSKGEEITINTAQKVAVNFVAAKKGISISKNVSTLSVENFLIEKRNEKAVFYLFELNNTGFVMIAADDASTPILGYSLTSSYDRTNIPPALREMMNSYAEQIVLLRENGSTATESIKQSWKNILEGKINTKSGGVAPLIKTTWAQGLYYNDQCPEDDDGEGNRVLVGCGAVALGQVMAYHKYPLQGKGKVNYYIPDYGIISADFANTEYNWNYMENKLNDCNDEVAKVLAHSAIALRMKFGPGASSSFMDDMPNVIPNYFNYNAGMSYIRKMNFVDSTWLEIIKGNLDSNLPVIYGGYQSNNAGGHAFVCDGYDNTDMLHFNWGWNGTYDGYFVHSDLNPGSTWDISYMQDAVIDVYPADNYPYYCDNNIDTLIGETGCVFDGSFNEEYQNNMSCSSLIYVEEAEYLTLEFDEFDTEENKDIVTIYDGPSTSSAVLGSYSGATLPSSALISSGNEVLVVFTTDGANTAKGWNLNYSSKLPRYCSGMTTLTESFGEISDGSGDFNYSNSSMCIWYIEPPLADEIYLSFESFNTEKGRDFLKIFDKSTNTLLKILTGDELPEPVTINSGKAQLLFTTNTGKRLSGWKIKYASSPYQSIEENSINSLFRIYPNPTSGLITVESNKTEKVSEIILLDVLGNVVLNKNIDNDKKHLKESIDVSVYPKGVYVLRIFSEEGIANKKLIVE